MNRLGSILCKHCHKHMPSSELTCPHCKESQIEPLVIQLEGESDQAYRRRVTPDLDMKSVLHAMLSGWCLQNNMTEEEKDGMEDYSYFLPYTNNDRRAAECLYLFSYWSNDLLSVAADYGMTTELIDGKFKVVNTPPRPSEKHWFDCGGYEWDQATETQNWKPGQWREPLEEQEDEVSVV